jgi:peptidoglycan/LPS O-acetylase OafA/YrhL
LNKARRTALGLLLVGPLLRIAVYYFWPEGRTQTAMMLPTAADSMMAGAALALYEGNAGFEALFKRFSLDLVALIAAMAVFIVSPILHLKFTGAYDLPVGRTINAVSIAIIILYVTRRPETPIGLILNSRIVVFVGVLSYSLYLWQQLFLTSLNTTWTGKYPVNLAVCFAVATLSYFFIERPFLRLKDRIPKRQVARLEDTANGLPEPVTVALRSKKSGMMS